MTGVSELIFWESSYLEDLGTMTACASRTSWQATTASIQEAFGAHTWDNIHRSTITVMLPQFLLTGE